MLILGDAQEKLKRLIPCSVDACVTDPPYGLAFMGKAWDYDVPTVEFWREVLRVLKPGAHLLAFGGTRTYHRMVVNIEDAGFEIRDQIQWIYGSGFPKSHDLSKGIDKRFGGKREVIGSYKATGTARSRGHIGAKTHAALPGDYTIDVDRIEITEPATLKAKEWSGWGTALKPANEPIVLARKPMSQDTVVKNVLKHKTGALNIDACRIDLEGIENHTTAGRAGFSPTNKIYGNGTEIINSKQERRLESGENPRYNNKGRWPSNVILDEEAAKLLDEQSGIRPGMTGGGKHKKDYKGGMFGSIDATHLARNDSGGASRFFYCAKASKSERNAGLEGMEEKETPTNMCSGSVQNAGTGNRLDGNPISKNQNHHPTVKPIKLMAYLCKLVAPPKATILDPFMGSGSTGVACKEIGVNFIGIERDAAYFEIAKRRIEG